MKMDKTLKKDLSELLEWTRQKLEAATYDGDTVQVATWQGRITGVYDVLDIVNGYQK